MFLVALNESEELGDSLFLRDVFEDTFLAAIEGDAVATGADVTVVGVCHLAGTVDDATHDGDLETGQVRRSGFHFFDGVLKVEHGASATRAGDILRFIYTHARGLEDVLAKEIEFGF